MRCPSPRSWFIYQALHFSQLQLGLFSISDSGKISSKVWLSLDFGVLSTTDILPTSLCEETRFSLHLCLHSSLEVSFKWEALLSHTGTWIWDKTSQSLKGSLSCCISCSFGNGSVSSELANTLIFCSFSLCQEMDAGYDSTYLYKKIPHTETGFRNKWFYYRLTELYGCICFDHWFVQSEVLEERRGVSNSQLTSKCHI